MNIQYTYSIDEVNEENKTMLVTYSATGLTTTKVSARLPFVDETLDDVIKAHAPYNLWTLEGSEYGSVSAGLSGVIEPEAFDEGEITVADLASAKEAKYAEIKEWRKAKQLGFIIVDGYTVHPNQRTLNALRSVKDGISSGLYIEVNYKFANDEFHVIGIDTVNSLITAVSLAIQSLYDDEKSKIEEVSAITDMDAVNAYSPSLGASIPSS